MIIDNQNRKEIDHYRLANEGLMSKIRSWPEEYLSATWLDALHWYMA